MKVQEFRPNNVDREYLEDFTKIKMGSYYFGSGTKRYFNSKIMRVGLVDQETEYSNLFSKYGSNPYDVVDLIFIIEKVHLGYTENIEYKIIMILDEKFYFLSNDPNNKDTLYFSYYDDAKKQLTKILKMCQENPESYKDILLNKQSLSDGNDKKFEGIMFLYNNFKFIYKGSEDNV
jgi:hypothetical protein